jgi:hypothetical protein
MELTTAVLEPYGNAPDTTSVITSHSDFIAGRDINGQVEWSAAANNYYTPSGLQALQTVDQLHYNLNGLLICNTAYVATQRANYYNHVALVPTPSRVNEAQCILGRSPGVDSFRLVRTPGAGVCSVGNSVISLLQKEITVADLPHWVMVDHDLRTNNHIQSWLSSPDWLCETASRTAAGLVKKYGDRIYEPKHTRPIAVSDFVNGIDKLSLVTAGLFDAVAPVQRVRSRLLQKRVEASIITACRWDRSVYLDGFLAKIGLIPVNCPEKEQARRQYQLLSAMAGHIAAMHITLEEVAPNPRLSRRQRIGRLDALSTIVKNYPNTIAA